jgi:hypothetical protein
MFEKKKLKNDVELKSFIARGRSPRFSIPGKIVSPMIRAWKQALSPQYLITSPSPIFCQSLSKASIASTSLGFLNMASTMLYKSPDGVPTKIQENPDS